MPALTFSETTDSIEPRALRDALVATLPEAATHPERILIVRSPGRVNLIGEHTDYNAGLVMPAAIGLEIRIALIPTDDRSVTLMLQASGEIQRFDLDDIGPPIGSWVDYARGMAVELVDAGTPVHGFAGLLASSLPQGAGLSSSAALELAIGWALAGASDPSIDRLAMAQLAQRAENEYVGMRCGLMDQFAVAHGESGAALLFDCRSLEHWPVPLPLATHALVVCHSGSPHKLESSEYNERRHTCEEAVATIALVHPEVHTLRDVHAAMLPEVETLLDERSFRRVRHVVTENARVLATRDALAAGDLAAVGRAWAASHASLRDDYEVSSPELDALVDIATATPGVTAARMTGGGFGGSTVNLVERPAVPRLREGVGTEYPRRTGLEPTVLEVEPVAGVGYLMAEGSRTDH